MKFYSIIFVALSHGAVKAWMYIIHICFKFGQYRYVFYCILRELFCIGEGALEQVIISGQILGYVCWCVYSKKGNSVTSQV